jgi:DNA-directed RNA polymerase subunit M/transcription elongation factor TFIIS
MKCACCGADMLPDKELENTIIYKCKECGLSDSSVERQGADIQSKVEELEQLNQSMRDRDKLKDDAIAHLSDQLIALTARLD